jgi:hypothetical protein
LKSSLKRIQLTFGLGLAKLLLRRPEGAQGISYANCQSAYQEGPEAGPQKDQGAGHALGPELVA